MSYVSTFTFLTCYLSFCVYEPDEEQHSRRPGAAENDSSELQNLYRFQIVDFWTLVLEYSFS